MLSILFPCLYDRIDDIKGLSHEILSTGTGNRFILGIDGLSRSGKTTLINKLSHMLQEKNIPICVFHMDVYIERHKKRYDTQHKEWYEYYNLTYSGTSNGCKKTCSTNLGNLTSLTLEILE